MNTKKLKHSLLLLAIGLTIPNISGREIQGKVINESDETPLSDASCILQSDSITVSQSATDISGNFTLSTASTGKGEVEISNPDYESVRILVPEGTKNINLGIIRLSKVSTLAELTVQGNSVAHKDGKTIVFPSKYDVSSSTGSLDLLNKLPLPGLLANPETRSISVNGGTPVILIDGVPSSLTDVYSIRPKDIEKIEYTDYTPARYAGGNNQGYINLILKRRSDGGSVYLFGQSALTTTFTDATVNASYHTGKSQFSLSYNPSWRNYHNVTDITGEKYIGNDFRVDISSEGRAPFNYITNPLSLKYTFNNHGKTILSASLSAYFYNTHRTSFTMTKDSFLGDYDVSGDMRQKQSNQSLDIFFKQLFSDRNWMEVQVVGTLSSNSYDWQNGYHYTSGEEQQYRTDVDAARRSLISEIIYSHRLNKFLTLSGGYRNSISYSRNKYIDSGDRPTLTDNDNYIYAQAELNFDRLYVSASSGAKMLWSKNDENRRHFIRNSSQFNLSWNISDKWNASAIFSYSPTIPDLVSLTDHPQKKSPYLTVNGNPDYKSSETYYYALRGSYDITKINVYVGTFFIDSHNIGMNAVSYLGHDQFISRPVNGGRFKVTGGQLNLTLRDFYGFSFRGMMYFSHGENDFMGQHLSRNCLSFYLNAWWSHGPFTVSYFRSFPGMELNGQILSYDMEGSDALSFSYRPDKHWTLGARWSYMFSKKGWKHKTENLSEVNPSVTNRYIKNNSNMVVLSVTYTADFGKIFQGTNRNLHNSDNGTSIMTM